MSVWLGVMIRSALQRCTALGALTLLIYGIGLPAKAPRAEANEQPANAPAALWSLQPISAPTPPRVAHADWPANDVDRFLLARLEQRGLKPAPQAPPHQLLRRLYFDLIGLPPTAEALARFEADASPQRWAQIVDQLLASPQFGERWARHWFDVVRYAESAGNSRDVLMPYAWRYRDYVIDAINADTPYDRFVTEQIAGDLLSSNDPSQRDRLRIATGLLAVGSKSLNGGNLQLDIVDDQIDVIGKAILGLTISCARCHDHKFDPIPAADYYALAGIFTSTETLYGGGVKRPKKANEKLAVYLVVGEHGQSSDQARHRQERISQLESQRATLAKRVKNLRKANAAKGAKKKRKDRQAAQPALPAEAATNRRKRAKALKEAQQELRRIQQQLKQLEQGGMVDSDLAMGVRESKSIADTAIRLRGERNKAGQVVPRGFLSCVALDGVSRIKETGQSGRRELAHWLTRPEHPLTARVVVNRVWAHLFGRGIVETVDNFGVNGARPTHPQLLDHLAHRFVRFHGWSIKSLVRELVSTQAYRMSGLFSEAAYAVDPENELHWRHPRRRLEAEPLRDSLLAISGQLRWDRPVGGSPVARIGEGEVGRGIDTRPLTEPFLHRSVYLPILRTRIPEFLKLFDLPEPSNPQGSRVSTNVPAQSLYFLNSPFVIGQADALAKRALGERSRTDERLDLIFRLCLGRSPSPEETANAQQFLENTKSRFSADDRDEQQPEQAAWSALAQAVFASAEFRFVD